MGAVLSKLWSDLMRHFGVGLVRSSAGTGYSRPTGNQMDVMDDSMDQGDFMDAESESQDALMEQEPEKSGETSTGSVDFSTPEKASTSPSKIPPSSPLKSNWEENSDRPNPTIEKEALPAEKKTKLEAEPEVKEESPAGTSETITFESIPNLQFSDIHESYRPETLSPADPKAPDLVNGLHGAMDCVKQGSQAVETDENMDLDSATVDKTQVTENSKDGAMNDTEMQVGPVVDDTKISQQPIHETVHEDAGTNDAPVKILENIEPVTTESTSADAAMLHQHDDLPNPVASASDNTSADTAKSDADSLKTKTAQDTEMLESSTGDTAIGDSITLHQHASEDLESSEITVESKKESDTDVPKNVTSKPDSLERDEPQDSIHGVSTSLVQEQADFEGVADHDDMEIDNENAPDSVDDSLHAAEGQIIADQERCAQETGQSELQRDIKNMTLEAEVAVSNEQPSRVNVNENTGTGTDQKMDVELTQPVASHVGEDSTHHVEEDLQSTEGSALQGKMVKEDDDLPVAHDNKEEKQVSDNKFAEVVCSGDTPVSSDNTLLKSPQRLEAGDNGGNTTTADDVVVSEPPLIALHGEMAGGDMPSSAKVVLEQVCKSETTDRLALLEQDKATAICQGDETASATQEDGNGANMDVEDAQECNFETDQGTEEVLNDKRGEENREAPVAFLKQNHAGNREHMESTIPDIVISTAENAEGERRQWPESPQTDDTEKEEVTDALDEKPDIPLQADEHTTINGAEVTFESAKNDPTMQEAALAEIQEPDIKVEIKLEDTPSIETCTDVDVETPLKQATTEENLISAAPTPEKSFEPKDTQPVTPEKYDAENIDPNRQAKSGKSVKAGGSQVLVQWSGYASEVQVTGSWSDWMEKIELQKTGDNVWSRIIDFDQDLKDVEMKFIVDGNWVVSDDMPWRDNEEGIRNNYVKLH